MKSKEICAVCFSEEFQTALVAGLICKTCRTIVLPKNKVYQYDENYPSNRKHYDQTNVLLKKKTSLSWLKKNRRHMDDIKINNYEILDVGFGGGGSLLALKDFFNKYPYGIEPVKSNIDNAISIGFDAKKLYSSISELVSSVPDSNFGYIQYLDSFEHIEDPRSHIQQINEIMVPGAYAFLVLPRADSISRKLMDQHWVHNVRDHWIHYSRDSLVSLWREFGWEVENEFYPWKYINLQIIVDHKLSSQVKTTSFLNTVSFPFNFGQMAVLFKKVKVKA